jgi:AcrR family transcriptional regulator
VPEDPTPRERLLEAAIDVVAARGITDLSLRELAAKVGTSHRMLIHHFGSKDGLWVAIVKEVERRQVDVMASMAPSSTASLEDAMWSWWKHVSHPSLWPNERLFFEIYGQALQGRSPAKELLDGIVDTWLEPATRQSIAVGVPRKDARAFARLGIAVTRGLLLDLLATEDRRGVDAAMRQFIRLLAAAVPR